jgi:DNA-binding NarL/FixJ family response regulator
VIRVVLVDDEPIVRSGIAMLLSGEPGIEVIADLDGGQAAVDLAIARRPDVVITDVRMPGMDGVETTRRIVAATTDGNDGLPAVKVLVLTTFHVDQAVYDALRAGASGFILKDAAPTELVAAVRAIAAGEGWLDPAVAGRLIDEFAMRPASGLPTPEELRTLTSREREVLVLIAHGLSNAEISDHLVVGEGTTKTHVSRIFAKLGLRDRAQAVATAYKCGLVSAADPVPSRQGSRPS